MAGKKKQVNQVAKKAATDGKITEQEAQKVQAKAASLGVNNAAVAIARAAVNNQASIAEQVQASLGLEQNKNNTKVNFNPAAATTWGVSAPSPGVAPVTGFVNQSSNNPRSGHSTSQVPVYTFTSRKGSTAKTTAPAAPASDPNAAQQPQEQNPMNPMTDQWGESVDNGLADLEAILAQQMAANAEQTSLYMGMMQDMMSQMQMAQQTAPQGAYAATTYQVAPAAGAQQTLAITPRKPVANTSLSIDAAPTQASGVGVNLAI